MNIGLGNLTELKGQLLAASLRADTNYDAVISGIGLGVANYFDQYLQPDFRADGGPGGHFLGDRRHWYLNCFPVESISALAKKDDESDGFVSYALPPDPSSLIQAMQMDQGYIMFIALQGYYWSRIQVTYTGGFWFDTTEDGSGVMPAGATPLPAAVKFGLVFPVPARLETVGQTGAQIAQNPEGQWALGALGLIPMVEELLRPFKRRQIT